MSWISFTIDSPPSPPCKRDCSRVIKGKFGTGRRFGISRCFRPDEAFNYNQLSIPHPAIRELTRSGSAVSDKPRYARNASRSICRSRRLLQLGLRDTSEAGERDCESLPRVVKRGAVKKRRRKKRKKPKRPGEGEAGGERERDGGG